MKDKINKFLEVEDRVFRAPYNFLKEKGIIDKVKEIKTRFVEIYEKDEMIVSLRKECETLKESLNDYEKCKGENNFLRKENSRLKDEIKSQKDENYSLR